MYSIVVKDSANSVGVQPNTIMVLADFCRSTAFATEEDCKLCVCERGTFAQACVMLWSTGVCRCENTAPFNFIA